MANQLKPSTYTGTHYTQQQVEDIWIRNGGSREQAQVMAAVAMAESSGWSGAYNPNDPHGGSHGIWQINGPGGSDDPDKNAQQAIAKLNAAGGNPAKDWGAYKNGSYKKFMPDGVTGSDKSDNNTIKASTTGSTTATVGVNDKNAAFYNGPVPGLAVSQNVLNQLTPLVQIDDGTDERPWYSDPSLLTANPRARRGVQPVSFQIYLDRKLTNKLHVKGHPEHPIVLQLNCGLASHTKTMTHIYTKTPSRTGFHVTFWGMRPDTITGQGTTGLFMNQFGISSYMSTANFTGAIRAQVLKWIQMGSQTFNPNQRISGLGIASENLVTPGNDASKLLQSLDNEALRVAAQDAFQELLQLFRNNGVTYFFTDKYSGAPDNLEQQAPTAWSPVYGDSVLGKNARNNDVLSKGYVAFNFRESTYLGYFKSLSWTMDAAKPYQWTFNFVFQVERELTLMHYAGA